MYEPVKHSTTHACTYLFGSICLGSLLVAINQTFRLICRQFEEDSGNAVGAVLARVAQCILSNIQSLVETFNFWAFCVISVCSVDFLGAGRVVIQFMEHDFIEAISSIHVTYIVTRMANLFIGLLIVKVIKFMNSLASSGSC